MKLKVSTEFKENKIVIGRETASKFLIKPIHKIFESQDIVNNKKIIPAELNQLHIIDERIEKIRRQLILSSKLRPVNYFEELDNFITWNGKYNPKFIYKLTTEEKFNEIETELTAIQNLIKNKELKSEFKKIFEEKLDELFNRLYLLKAYKKQDFENIELYNKKIFGEFDEELLKISKEKIFSNINNNKESLGKILSPNEIHKQIETHLLEK
jgi:hypothetical protein